jgi:hypothetical protein
MRFLFIRLFFEAAAAEGGAGGDNQQQQQQQQGNDNADAKALLEKFTALETKNTELEKKIAELLKPKEGDQNQQQQDNKGKDAEVPEYVKKQNELIEKLVNTVTTLQTEKVVTTRRTVLETELKGIEGLSDAYRDEVIDNFNGRSFKDDAEFETFKKAKVEAAKKLAQEQSAGSISIFTAPGKSAGGNGNKVSSAMSEYLKAKTPQAAAKN